VYAKDEADVLACIRYVDKHHLDVAVAGGRHSYHGASSGSSLVIGRTGDLYYSWCLWLMFIVDLKEMNEASVDKSSMTVTAQGGCVARDLEQPAEAEGLSVVFGAVNETGKALIRRHR